MALPFDDAEAGRPAADAVAGAPGEGAWVGTQALERLMRQALEVPGAAAALLEAFAAQSQVLHLVQEADARGAASLPTDLRRHLDTVSARTPTWLAAFPSV